MLQARCELVPSTDNGSELVFWFQSHRPLGRARVGVLPGGNEPIVGATLTYTITVVVKSAGTATDSTIRDVIPTYSVFVPNSITLNGNAVSDAMDLDAGEYDTTGVPAVVVRLGDLTQGDAGTAIRYAGFAHEGLTIETT